MNITSVFDSLVAFLHTMVLWMQSNDVILGNSAISWYDFAVGMMLADCTLVSLIPFGGDDEND